MFQYFVPFLYNLVHIILIIIIYYLSVIIDFHKVLSILHFIIQILFPFMKNYFS